MCGRGALFAESELWYNAVMNCYALRCGLLIGLMMFLTTVVTCAAVSTHAVVLGNRDSVRCVPYGVCLGERMSQPLSALTDGNLARYALTNDIVRMRMPNSKPRRETIKLSRPLMGIFYASVAVDHEGVGYEFSISGSFRRGLAREESLRKIEMLRRDVEQECGFKLNDYSFAASGANVGTATRAISPEMIGEEGRGQGLWMDLDRVVANSVTTHNGLRVSIACRVNDAKDASTGGMDSPVYVVVDFILVDVLKAEEDRMLAERQYVSDMVAASKSARIAEFCGVKFGKSLTPLSTNELTKTYYETWTVSDNGKKKSPAKVYYWKKAIPHPKSTLVPFVDTLYAWYSLKTRIPESLEGFGKVSADVCMQEVQRRFDEFALVMNRQYGVLIRRVLYDDGLIRYEFQNNWVYVLLESMSGRVWFRLEDRSVHDVIRKEGWEDIYSD